MGPFLGLAGLDYVPLLSSLKASRLPTLPCPTAGRARHQVRVVVGLTHTKKWMLPPLRGAEGSGSEFEKGAVVSLLKVQETFLYGGKRGKVNAKTVSCELLLRPFDIVASITVPDSLGLIKHNQKLLLLMFFCFFFPLFGTTFPFEFCRAGEDNKPPLILRYVDGGCGPVWAGRSGRGGEGRTGGGW